MQIKTGIKEFQRNSCFKLLKQFVHYDIYIIFSVHFSIVS